MRSQSLFLVIFTAFLLFVSACSNRSERAPSFQSSVAPGAQDENVAGAPPPPPAEKPIAMDNLPAQLFSSSAARPGALDSLRRFIRTAEMKFRTDNVLHATLQVEDIAAHFKGFVSVSNLGSQIEERRQDPVSKDSCVEVTAYSVNCHIVLRVPYQQLDSTLRSIGRLAEFVDFRNIKAEDMHLQQLERALAQARLQQYQSTVEDGATQTKDADKVGNAADRVLSARAQSDEQKIELLKLADQIQYSTITLDMYQAPQVRQTKVANTEVEVSKPPYKSRIGRAIRNGGTFLAELFIGVLNLWAVLLVLGLLLWMWRRWRNNKNGK